MTAEEKARILLQEIHEALERGTKHYALDGTPLLTAKEIVEALMRDQQIRFEPAGETPLYEQTREKQS